MKDIKKLAEKKKQSGQRYQAAIASVDPAQEVDRKINNHQPYASEKAIGKGIAIGTAAALAVGGVVAGGIAIANNQKDKADEPNDKASVVGDENTDEISQASLEYVLNEEFYINETEVKQAQEDGNKTVVTVDEVIKDIKDNVDLNTVKSYVEKGTNQEQDDINLNGMINYYNGTIERSDYSSNDAEGIFHETQAFLVAPYSMFSQNATDYANAKASLLGGNSYNKTLTDKKVITPGAILESKGDIKEYNNAFAKNLNEQLSDIRSYNDQIKVVEKQIEDSKASSEDKTDEIKKLEEQLSELNTKMNKEFDENAKGFYDLFEKVTKNKKLTDAQKSIYYNYVKAVASDYKLSASQLEKINKELQSLANNGNFFDVLKDKGILTDEEYADIIALSEKDGTFGKPLTELGEKNNSADEADANSRVGTPANANEKNVKKGGNQSAGSDGKEEQINNPSTTTETETNVEKVPDSETEKNDRVDKETGGNVVDETTEVKDQEQIGEDEIVNPSQEETPVEEESTIFTDADGEDFEDVYSEEDYAKLLTNM